MNCGEIDFPREMLLSAHRLTRLNGGNLRARSISLCVDLSLLLELEVFTCGSFHYRVLLILSKRRSIKLGHVFPTASANNPLDGIFVVDDVSLFRGWAQQNYVLLDAEPLWGIQLNHWIETRVSGCNRWMLEVWSRVSGIKNVQFVVFDWHFVGGFLAGFEFPAKIDHLVLWRTPLFFIWIFKTSTISVVMVQLNTNDTRHNIPGYSYATLNLVGTSYLHLCSELVHTGRNHHPPVYVNIKLKFHIPLKTIKCTAHKSKTANGKYRYQVYWNVKNNSKYSKPQFD